MRIAILGAGSVGGTLGKGFGARGHQVSYGVRDPAAPAVQAVVAASGPSARAAAPAEAVREAEVVVLATPWEATLELVRGLSLTGKVVVDATNPLAPGLTGLVVAGTSSGGEEVQRSAPGARVVKCFNTTGADNFVDARYPGGPVTMLYAGDDAEAKAIVRTLGAGLRARHGGRGAAQPEPAAGTGGPALDNPGLPGGDGAGDRLPAGAAG
ncbi:MAG: NAD(P)-binding domain-containing protein [Gemmatimonadetes bacterium]|nr:NAD(P)-binding domain-containing protein [Gemmatimonadota bacterium]